MPHPARTICFVTGTRAEFGLMRRALDAIRAHPRLRLRVVATGMHLDPRHGRGVAAMADDGFPPDAVVPWPAGAASPAAVAAHTGAAMAALADAFDRLAPDVVLVVGDRVEAFAAAAAAHIGGRCVAHVHGGDRALGQVDDALRHAITKLAHVHFPATVQSAARLRKLGEDAWRIHRVGSPGIDGIRELALPAADLRARFPGLRPRRYALLVLHPADADAAAERRRAAQIAGAADAAGFDRVVVVHPNNDPGAAGILAAWDQRRADPRYRILADTPRPLFLALMRDAAVLVGNSSSGIIEAASFGTPVVDVGPRQAGRERGSNVTHVPYDAARITAALRRARAAALSGARRPRAANIYGGRRTAAHLAAALADLTLTPRLLRKLIAY